MLNFDLLLLLLLAQSGVSVEHSAPLRNPTGQGGECTPIV
jgi:hypothetical protein